MARLVSFDTNVHYHNGRTVTTSIYLNLDDCVDSIKLLDCEYATVPSINGYFLELLNEEINFNIGHNLTREKQDVYRANLIINEENGRKAVFTSAVRGPNL